jgi:nucleotide-binding universal stress UspA family protein
MGKILCATRGGEDSYRTQQRAITLAKEQGDELVFLYVADVSFLNMAAAPMVVDMESRLEKLGRFQLAMAQEQAAEQAIVAKAIVRQGQLLEELVAAAQEIGATLVVLGRPLAGTGVFDEAAFLPFAARLRAELGVDVHILESESLT